MKKKNINKKVILIQSGVLQDKIIKKFGILMARKRIVELKMNQIRVIQNY